MTGMIEMTNDAEESATGRDRILNGREDRRGADDTLVASGVDVQQALGIGDRLKANAICNTGLVALWSTMVNSLGARKRHLR